MKKRGLSIILALAMIVGLFAGMSVSVYAKSTPISSITLSNVPTQYIVSGETCTVVNDDGSAASVGDITIADSESGQYTIKTILAIYDEEEECAYVAVLIRPNGNYAYVDDTAFALTDSDGNELLYEAGCYSSQEHVDAFKEDYGIDDVQVGDIGIYWIASKEYSNGVTWDDVKDLIVGTYLLITNDEEEYYEDVYVFNEDGTCVNSILSYYYEDDESYSDSYSLIIKDGSITKTDDKITLTTIEVEEEEELNEYSDLKFTLVNGAVTLMNDGAEENHLKGIRVTDVSLGKESINLAVGGEETLSATIAPENAILTDIIWTSSDESVATIDEDGTVTAVAGGTATITATTLDGRKTATCEVTVGGESTPISSVTLSNVPTKYTASDETYKVVKDNGEEANVSDITIASGENKQFTIKSIDVVADEEDTFITMVVRPNGNYVFTKDTVITITNSNNEKILCDGMYISDEEDVEGYKEMLSIEDLKIGDYVFALQASKYSGRQKKSNSSGGGGLSTHTITVQVTAEKETVKVQATVSGYNATIKNITSAEIEKVVDQGDVIIDLTDLNKSVSGVIIPKTTMDNIAKSEASGLDVKLPNGTAASFDKQTIDAVNEQAKGNNIQFVLNLDAAAEETLSNAQKATIAGMNKAVVLDAYFISSGTRISDFKGGKAEITAAYPTEKPVRVWYVLDDGSKELVPSTYDGKTASFTVTHFSHYVVEELEDSNNEFYPQENTCDCEKFKDIDSNAWYHDGIHFCIQKGYMNGISTTKFAPNGTLSRAMIVTILWNMEDKPVVNYEMSFADVKADDWYKEAIRWAQSTGVVDGYSDTTFGPTDDVTREQLAAILYRYASYKGINVSTKNKLAKYTDAKEVSTWAIDNVQWAIAVGVITGRTDTTIVPAGNATRAEAATMVQRLCEIVIE